MARTLWTSLPDAELLAQCAVDTYRASGPGGQKRNKTSSAVRLRHLPSGQSAIAEESRSQHENKARALRRLRERLWLTLRESVPAEKVRALEGFLVWSRKDSRYWPGLAVVLDLLVECQGRVSVAAGRLGISTGQLIDYLLREESVWIQANQIRRHFGHRPLVNQ